MKKALFLLLAVVPFSNVFANYTQLGKITWTQGHISPNCRNISLKENVSGSVLTFRIQDSGGKDDINAVALAAMISDRNVVISYEPGVTSGCGPEPRVTYISIY